MGALFYLVGLLCIFTSIYYIVILFTEYMGRRRWKVASRLQMIKDLEDGLGELDPMNRSFKERVIIPLSQKLGKLLESLTPAELKKSISTRLIAAGYSGKTAFSNFLIIQGGLAILLPVVFVLVSIASANRSKAFTFSLIGFVLSLLLPMLVINNKKNLRQNQIRKNLPDTLDLLVVSVEAGLGFDMALLKVTEKIKGVLSQELNGALAEIRMGKIRRMALREMAERTGVDELINFISAIFQADQLGVSIGNVLRVQSDAMRTYRRQKAEEQAAKAPIKMLFPLVFCIFPALFTILLGPTILQVMKTLTGMSR